MTFTFVSAREILRLERSFVAVPIYYKIMRSVQNFSVFSSYTKVAKKSFIVSSFLLLTSIYSKVVSYNHRVKLLHFYLFPVIAYR